MGTATVSAGQATLSYTFVTAISHSLTASYSGDANNAASTSSAVAQVISVGSSTTSLAVSSTLVIPGEPVVLTATVAGALPNGTVTFLDGTTVLGTATLAASKATLNTTFSAVGAHSLTASYSGDANNTASTSGTAVSLTVATEKITYYHNDISGTPMAATNSTGALLWKESYRPYGDPMRPPAIDNNIWFTGKPYDKDSGLSYMGARYYDPLIGRFTGIDPVGFKEGNLHSFNRYAYANNNPNRFVDPDGRCALLLFQQMVEGMAAAGGLYHPATTPSSSSTEYPAELQLGGGTPPHPIQQMINGIGGFISDVIRLDDLIISSVTQVPGNKPPFTGEPGSTVQGGTGSRTYGPDGYPLRDRDLGHPDEKGIGSGDHSHDWGRPEGGGAPSHNDRGSGRAPLPDDPPVPRGPNVPAGE